MWNRLNFRLTITNLIVKIYSADHVKIFCCLMKYYGDVLLQKTYIADFFTGKQVSNRGECESYVALDHHPAIIPRGIRE